MLAAEAIGKSIKGFPAVADVSLHIRRGEVVGLIGPGGAGKTTTFRMLAGVTTPDRGRVTLDDADVTDLPLYERARRGLSYLPQEPSIFRGLSVEDNIMVMLEAHEPDGPHRREKLDRLLDLFGLTRLRTSRASRLSGGERRRCEIARALAGRPSFVLLDEPFAGVDPLAVEDVRKLVRLMTAQDIGVLITDHNARELLSLVDRAYVIHAGRVFMDGSPEAVVADPMVRRVYLGESFTLNHPRA